MKKNIGLILGFSALLIISARLAFIAKKIECFSQYGPCPSDLIAISQSLVGTKLFWPLPKTYAQNLFSKNSQVQSINLDRLLPSTLIVRLTFRRPAGIVASVQGQGVVVDDSGYAFASASGVSLPSLFSDHVPALGTKSPWEVTQALGVLSQIRAMYPTISQSKLSGSRLDFSLPPINSVVIDLDRLDSNWYTALQVILARSKMTGKIPRKVDLRYSRPVLEY